MRSRLLCLVMTLAIGGCDLVRDQLATSRATINGLPSDIELISDPAAGAKRETDFLRALIVRAGLEPDRRWDFAERDWRLVMLAGVRVIDGQCDQYLGALFRFNRQQRAGRQGLAAAAAAAGSIMGLAGAAATAISITAAAFGLTESLFDAAVGSVLFTIEPSALRNVVLQGRSQYLEAIKDARVTSRPIVMILLQGYLIQCTPAAIEAGINNAANGSPNAVTIPWLPNEPSAALLAAPAARLAFADQPEPPVPPGRRNAARLGNGLLAGEQPRPRETIINIQRFLGAPPTGDRDSKPTRDAIKEFQRGLAARRSPDPATWLATGALTGETERDLLSVTPVESPFKTPFERAFLGNLRTTAGGAPRFSVPEPSQLDKLWGQLRNARSEDDPSPDRLLPTIRERLAALDPRSRADTLDSVTWARLQDRVIPSRAAP